MFVKADKNQDRKLNLFTNVVDNLHPKMVKEFEDPDGWHNFFYQNVTLNINEEIFRPLYKEGNMGAPTKDLYRVAAMICIKEGLGCSDAQLEEFVKFNLLVRAALGLQNIDDLGPTIDAYYLLKRRIVDNEKKTGVNLMRVWFKDLTKLQLKSLNISGKVVRMDSMFVGSNISWPSRYQLVHDTLVKEISKSTAQTLKEPLRTKVLALLEEDAQKTVYNADKETINNKFLELGQVVHAVLAALKKKDGLLHRVFYEQFRLEKKCDEKGKSKGPKVAVPIPNKDIKSKSVQNPNDPDAEYRNKRGKKVKGYVGSMTETLEEGKPSLIVDAQLEGATTADTKFTQAGIEGAKEVTGVTPEEALCDGAYMSPEVREYCEENKIELITSGLQGKDSRFTLEYDENGDLKVFDKLQGKGVNAVKVQCKDGEKWRIQVQDKNGKKTYRYFDAGAIERDQERQRLASISAERKIRRNNVESTMFFVGCNFRNHKTRYRGLERNRVFLYGRCIWINARRMQLHKIASDNMPK